MIPCQRALMLKSAMALEYLIKFSKPRAKGDTHSPGPQNLQYGITWNQIDQVPTFIAQLQISVRRLMEENRQLQKVHRELISKVV